MGTEEEYIAGLLLRSFETTLTESERLQLDEWLSQDDAHLSLYNELLTDDGALFTTLGQVQADREAGLSHQLYQRVRVAAGLNRSRNIYFLQKWKWVAASVLLALSIGLFFLISPRNTSSPDGPVAATLELPPGREGAILTLADGSQVVLDSLKNGRIASQAGASPTLTDGQVTYDANGITGSTVNYNILTTPRGRKFKLTLPDHTQVWLNSASSIRYPTVFSGRMREVEITGEAYFEVAKNTSLPFRVKANNRAVIEVLGTHFNVNAYDNEKVLSTTLLEGKIKVNNTLVRPGQQTQIDIHANTGVKLIDNADIEKVMAWKNDLFNFEGASLEEAMRQLERWYDIDVKYEKSIPFRKLTGKMTKDIPLTDLLIILKELGVQARLEGRTLIVEAARDR